MEPPFVGVAVNVTLVPAQMVLPGFAAMLTDGVTFAVTLIVIVFELAVDTVTQVNEEVITQEIRSPVTNAAF